MHKPYFVVRESFCTVYARYTRDYELCAKMSENLPTQTDTLV